ncbi:MAG: zinc-binding dehydrogenase [Cyanobacteria bacterium J06629_9]
MKALVYIQYGPPDVLQLKEVEKPLPGDDEVLIRVQATTVNRTDCATIRAKPFFMRLVTGLFKPKQQIPGTAFAGEVESVGKGVISLNVGDKVFGSNDQGAGCHAQYMTIKADKAVILPDKISYEQAAASPEGMHYAYNFINKVDLEKGQQVLVNGATGAIGSAAVQLLKDLGVQVTAVCSTPHINLVKSLGADRVIDYTKEDFTKDAQKYDFVFDAVGKSSFFKCRSLLKPGGVYISSDLGDMAQNLFLPLITSIAKPLIGGKKTVFPTPVEISGSLHLLKRLIEQGKFKAIIDKAFSLDQIVEAYRYVEKGHKTGNVVITAKHGGVMPPTIVQRTSFTVLGIVGQVRQGSETPELFSDIWQQFESRRQEIESLATGAHYFGVKFSTDQADVTDYLVGMRTPADVPVPEGLEKRTVPGSRFAVFEYPVEAIGEGYRHIFTEWLPAAAVQFNPTVPVFEEYPENGSQQPVGIYLPIRQSMEAL